MTPKEPARKATSLWSLAVLIVVVLGATEAMNWWQDQRQADELKRVLSQQAVQAKDVVMYTTSTCPYCAKARTWLKSNQVPFSECNVEQSAACLAQYELQGPPGVPLMKVRDQWHLGFDPAWLVLALQAQADKPNAAKSPRP